MNLSLFPFDSQRHRGLFCRTARLAVPVAVLLLAVALCACTKKEQKPVPKPPVPVALAPVERMLIGTHK